MTWCLICRAATHASSVEVYDDRYGYPGSFTVRVCDDCGHRSLAWAPTAEILSRLYSDYYPRASRDLSDFEPLTPSNGLLRWWRGERSSANLWVPERVRVLDIGCGFGESLAYHRARGCDVYGVEADRNIARVASHYGFNVHVGLFTRELYDAGSFDYVTMDQVIEHMIDPIATLADAAALLRRNGCIVLSTPNATSAAARIFRRRWINWHAPYHLHLFTRRSLDMAASKANLDVEHVETVTSSEWLRYQWIHALLMPARGEKSRFWSPGARRTLLQRAAVTALSLVHYTGIDHVATRLADALGQGDNLVAVLRVRSVVGAGR